MTETKVPGTSADGGVRGKGPASGPGQGGPGRGGGGPAGPSGPVWPILRRLLKYMRPHAAMLAGVTAAILLTTLAELAPPWLIRIAVDEGILAGRPDCIWWVAAALLSLSIVQGGIDFSRLLLSAQVGQRIVFGIRTALFEHLSRLSFSYYDRARTGDLMSRVTADVDALSQFFGRAAVIVVTNALTILGILFVLIIWDWRLGVVYLAFLPPIVLAVRTYASRVRPAMGQTRRHLGSVTSAVRESLTGISVVKLYGREAVEEEKVDRASGALRNAGIETTRITSLWMPFATVLGGVCTGLVLWIGGGLVIDQSISLGDLVGFTLYMGMLLRPIRQSGMMLSAVMRAVVAAERVFEVLDIEPEIGDAPGARILSNVRGRVRYEGIHFSYDNERDVLHGVDLEAEPGEKLALIGPSGSGKTTLAHLLPRFYEPQKGRILIDGQDIQGVTVKSLRDTIGIAMQTAFLFDASIGENIAYGSPGSAQAQIEGAASTVYLDEFIASLPLGYGTPVGEAGVRLSGGQRQRVALARVLLTNPRILILDEPTSSVDADTERQMQEALQEVWAGRTTLIIAHRLWTIQQADHIAVLDDGRVVEEGRGTGSTSAHDVLMAKKGQYRNLVDLQFGAESAMAERSKAQ